MAAHPPRAYLGSRELLRNALYTFPVFAYAIGVKVLCMQAYRCAAADTVIHSPIAADTVMHSPIAAAATRARGGAAAVRDAARDLRLRAGGRLRAALVAAQVDGLRGAPQLARGHAFPAPVAVVLRGTVLQHWAPLGNDACECAVTMCPAGDV